jgi:hypothetical protein
MAPPSTLPNSQHVFVCIFFFSAWVGLGASNYVTLDMILPWSLPLELQEVAATTVDFFSTSFVVFVIVIKLGNFWINVFS